MVLFENYLIIVNIIFYIFSDEVCPTEFGIVTENQIIIFSSVWYGVAYTTTDIGLNSIAAATYDPLKKDIYISDKKEESIFRIKTTGETAYIVGIPIVDKQNKIVLGLAYDYLHSTLYWTTINGGFYYVCVPDNDITAPLKVQVMFISSEQLPSSIAIDVDNRFLFWVNDDKKTQTAKIERSSLDEFGREVLVDDVAGPRDIKVDVEGNKLYWIKWIVNRRRTIDSMDSWVNGTRRTLVQATEHRRPSVIALGDRYVYWIDWVSGELWRMLKNSFQLNAKPTLVSQIELSEQPIALFVLSGGDAPRIRQR